MSDYERHVAALRETHPALAEEIANFRGLGGVMAWMATRGLKLGDVVITQQDEFSSDFVVPMPREHQWLAFGVT